MRFARAMRGIDGFYLLIFRPHQLPHYLTEAIAAIAHGQQLENIARPRLPPAARNRIRRSARAERAFEFVGDD